MLYLLSYILYYYIHIYNTSSIYIDSLRYMIYIYIYIYSYLIYGNTCYIHLSAICYVIYITISEHAK